MQGPHLDSRGMIPVQSLDLSSRQFCNLCILLFPRRVFVGDFVVGNSWTTRFTATKLLIEVFKR